MTANSRTSFVPLMTMALALASWFGFQTYQLLQEKNKLNVLASSQEISHKNSEKMRAQFDGLATGTSKLAQQGNPVAQQIVSGLAQRGITVAANAATPAPAK
jgi:urea transporter